MLVVDDTDHVRTMLANMLVLDGFDVVGQASSGMDAIQLADKLDPHVAVIDYTMPGMDGLTVARRILASRPDQAIILYTAYLDRKLEDEAKQAGVALCIGKVEGLTELGSHITDLSRHFR